MPAELGTGTPPPNVAGMLPLPTNINSNTVIIDINNTQ
jgi:hypothetical protein